MPGAVGRSWWRVVGVALLAFGVAFLVLAATARGDTRFQRYVDWATVLCVPSEVAGLAVLAFDRARGTAPPAVSTPDHLRAAANTLAARVRSQWTEEARLRGLADPEPMPVRWRLTERDLMDHARLVAAGTLSFDGRSDRVPDLARQFRALRRRRLVILGGPGSGKTTLAVQLLLELLADRDPDEPVPVLLSLGGWDTGTHPLLQDWLAARLPEVYPARRAPELGPDAVRSLVRSGWVLPVLDGLDELPPSTQGSVVSALNRSLADGDQLVLTSRTVEFGLAVDAAGDVVTSAAVVEPEPLTRDAVADYLESCLPPRRLRDWHRVLAAVRGPEPCDLAEVVSVPLYLWLLREVHVTAGADPDVLLDPQQLPDADAVRAHLLDRIVPAVVASRRRSTDPAEPFRPRHEWGGPDRVLRWLGYLADHLHRRGDRDLAWWHLACGVVRPRLVALALGVLVGGAVSAATRSPAAGLLWAVLFVVAAAIVLQVWVVCEPGHTDLLASGALRRLARQMRSTISVTMVMGTGFGAVSGIVVRATSGRLAGVIVGLGTVLLAAAAMVLVVLALSLVEMVESPRAAAGASTPRSALRGDRNLMLAKMLMMGAGLPGPGLAAGWIQGDALAGAVVFCGVGLLFGFLYSRYRAWLVYVPAARWLALRGRVPWRLMAFLDDAHRMGLLRTVGPVYQFRHADLQDHLAAAYRAAPGRQPTGQALGQALVDGQGQRRTR